MQVITEIAIHAGAVMNGILRSIQILNLALTFQCQIHYHNVIKSSLCLCLPTQLVSQ